MSKSIKNSSLFYEYYDVLYSFKNYDEEANKFVSIARKFYRGNIDKVLEIGAGTGNHTLALARHEFSLVAIDTDENMLRAASAKINQSKYPHVKLIHSAVESLEDQHFDLAFAGFNVVNYLKDFDSLHSFFKEVSRRLRKGGVFVFDCWNGIAAIKDPPESKTIQAKSGDYNVKCTVKGTTDFMEQKTTLVYSLQITDSGKREIAKGKFSFTQTLWTPFEIKHALFKANLKILLLCRLFQPETTAGENDWKIMFVCQKTN